jgi:hypothetical protein
MCVFHKTQHSFVNSSVGSILWETIVWCYNLTVRIISQKYQELSLQVEISE